MIIQSEKVWTANGFAPLQVEIREGKIEAVWEYGSKPVDRDFGSQWLLPGFIDVHTHGAYGYDTNDGEPEGLREWARRLPADEGVTSFLPTTITQSEEVLTKAVRNVATVMKEGYKGANILGIHFEGPYLDMKYKGAQPPEFILDADLQQFERYQTAAEGNIRYITIAPEHDRDLAMIRHISQNGVVVSMGHSAATFKNALLGVANGAMTMTHVYNGMTPYNHRELGLVGAAFRIRDIYGEIICDGYHSCPDALNNFFTIKGPDHAVMISDSLRCKGLPEGQYTSGGADITLTPQGTAVLTGTTTLAGSTLKINRGLQVLIEKALVPVASAINSCTLNPAKVLRVDDHKGRIVAGYDADMVVLDQQYNVVQCYVGGKEQVK